MSKDKKIYCHYTWHEDITTKARAPEDNCSLENVATYYQHDSSDKFDLHVVDEDGSLVVSKLNRNAAIRVLSNGERRVLRRIMKKACAVKPDVKRGKKNGGVSDRYVCFGFRKDPKLSGVIGEYAFKSSVDSIMAETLKDHVSTYVSKLEGGARRLITSHPDFHWFQELRETLDLPSVSCTRDGIATQFSIGVNYWSGAHVDTHYFFNFLSCLAEDGKDPDDIMYYFCFPEYKIAIPLRSGDVIVFNPLKYHCCSNCRYEKSLIFSAYVSRKTVQDRKSVV